MKHPPYTRPSDGNIDPYEGDIRPFDGDTEDARDGILPIIIDKELGDGI